MQVCLWQQFFSNNKKTENNWNIPVAFQKSIVSQCICTLNGLLNSHENDVVEEYWYDEVSSLNM